VQRDWVEALQDAEASTGVTWLLVALVLVVATAFGATVATMAGRSLRALARVPDPSAPEDGEALVWLHQPLGNPRGVAIGWAVLYGIGYELIVVALLVDPFGTHATWWHRVAVVTAVLFAVSLVLVVPWVLPLVEYAAVRRAERLRAGTVAEPPDYATDLAVRGLGFQRFVAGGVAPTLTKAGTRLRDVVNKARIPGDDT
jgi:hypothetical protein